MHTRRRFLGLVGGAVATASVPLAEAAATVEHGNWPPIYHLMVKLPQPKNRPIRNNPAGISYWIERPTEAVRCEHVGNGFYVGEHRGMKLRALAEWKGDKLICKTAAWDGEWNA